MYKDFQHDLRRARQRILGRIRRKYDIVHTPLTIGPVELDFVRIADPDRVLDQVVDEDDRRERSAGLRLGEDDLHLPYWAQLWDSALGIAAFLATRPATAQLPAGDSPGPSVLDLGCGMGLAGTVAAALGATVLFADIEPPSLLFAALNTLPWRGRVRTRRLNWRTDTLAERFDLIIGADILYERQQWEHLERFWRAHLHPGAPVLLGEPGRQTGDAFPDWIGSRSWKLDRFEQTISARPKPIRIFRLTL